MANPIAITTQPTIWGPPNCPPGLEYLTLVNEIFIKQKIEWIEVFTKWEESNKYLISNSLGQPIYFAAEETGCCRRQCCGHLRGFEIAILDNVGREVMHLHRPWRPCSQMCLCCCGCCLQKVVVTAPPGNVIGYVQQTWNPFCPRFSIQDADGNTVLRVHGSCCHLKICCCRDIEFPIFSATNGQEIGRISKKWSGLGREILTDSDNFGVSFPIDLDVKSKATLMAACFLIDFMFFEENPHQDSVNSR